MKPLFLVFMSGVIFAVGLGVSGMTDANKVVGFLNLGGQWDPSLAFVMVGAIAVHMVFQRIMTKRGSPIYGTNFERPPTHQLEWKLVGGSAIFGIGWGGVAIVQGPRWFHPSPVAWRRLGLPRRCCWAWSFTIR